MAAEGVVAREPVDTAGLSLAEVEERRRDGRVNVVERRTSRTVGGIVRANCLTRFNAIVTSLAVVVIVVGHPIDALFALVMVSNAVIGIVQELRAKRTLDRLELLVAPRIDVRRDGARSTIPASEVVADDLLLLGPGDLLPVDGVVLTSDGLEVDESALSGESVPVPKAAGDEVRSGSAVVAGSAAARATRVGADAWLQRLASEAKTFSLTRSELRVGVDGILRTVSWLLPPLAALLFWTQLRHHQTVGEGLVAAVAGVVALVPQGLVLLVSMALAVAVLRLARRHVVAQELPAVEGLARVDVICLDKTGTLTTGRMTLERLEPVGCTLDELRDALAAMAAADDRPTSTMRVVRATLTDVPDWQVTGRVPFSSSRSWSGVAFAGRGSWIVGAPEVLFDVLGRRAGALPERVAELTSTGRRAVLVGWSPGALEAGALPATLDARGLVVLSEELRVDAAETLSYFRGEGVAVKIVSGDNPLTVASIARRLGVPGADHHVDVRALDRPLAEIVDETTVFGRVRPEEKRQLVTALQAAGHTVAMTGDGINDVPALKRADIGIAMDTATSATKAVSQLVLLDGRFDRLPEVVAEGRRVVANMERVSVLFVAKTVYATLFVLGIAAADVEFLFLPRHLTVVDALTIGLPAFALSFRRADRPCRPGYLRRVLRFAAPAGVAAGGVTLAVYVVARVSPLAAPVDEARTAATVSLTVLGLWVLYRLIRPLDRIETALLVGLSAALAAVLAIGPLADVLELRMPSPPVVATSAALVGGSIVVLQAVLAVTVDRRRE